MGRNKSVILSESLPSECASLEHTHSHTHKTPPFFLGACFSFFFFLASRLPRMSTKWKIELFFLSFFLQGLLPKGALILLSHLVGCHSNLMEMRSWCFPDKSPVTGLRALNWGGHGPPGGVSKGLLEDVWPVGPGARDDGSCKDSAPCHRTCVVLNFLPCSFWLNEELHTYVAGWKFGVIQTTESI